MLKWSLHFCFTPPPPPTPIHTHMLMLILIREQACISIHASRILVIGRAFPGYIIYSVHTHVCNIVAFLYYSSTGKSTVYLFIEGLEPCQPHRVTSGLFAKSNLTQVEYNTKHAQFTNVNINTIRKLVPSVLLS